MQSVTYSPDGRHIISGSYDNMIRVWDAETGAAVGKPLEGHSGFVQSVAYSPDGRHIISGSWDNAIRIWDAETGAAVGKPLEGHSGGVESVAYSPDGRHIISGSYDTTIRIWDAKTGAPVGKPLEGYSRSVQSVAYSPDGCHIISASLDNMIRIWDADAHSAVGRPLEGETASAVSIAYCPNGQTVDYGSDHSTTHVSELSLPKPSSAFNPIHVHFFAQPDSRGWIRDSGGGLLYWVPPDCRSGLHSPAPITIPVRFHDRTVSLDFGDFAFGTAWTQIFNSVQV